MRKKIVGILICTLLAATVLSPCICSLNAEYKPSNANPRSNNLQVKCAWSGEGANLDNRAITETISIPEDTSINLEITTMYEILYVGDDDYGYVKLSDNGGSSWTILEIIQGYTPEWTTIEEDLIDWAGKNILIAFEFVTESDSISDGWWIQKIVVKASHEDIYYEDFSGYDIGDPWGDWIIIGHSQPPNAPPNIPTINGETNGKAGTEYKYTFTSTDPDLDNVFYYVKWGDGSPDVEWDGPHISGTPISINHTYTSKGAYTIEAKVKDTRGEESKLGILKVNIQKNKQNSMNCQQTHSLMLFQILKMRNTLNRFLKGFTLAPGIFKI